EVQDLAAVGLPSQVRLDGDPHDDVPVQIRSSGQGELGSRPRDLAFGLGAWLEADLRPGEAEVIELLGIDFGELLGSQGRSKVPHGRRRRLGGVVPAGKGHYQYRPPQALRTGVDFQRIHRLSITSPLLDVVRGSLARTAN